MCSSLELTPLKSPPYKFWRCRVATPAISYSDTLLPSGLTKVGLQIDLHQTCETFGVLIRRPFDVHIGTE